MERRINIMGGRANKKGEVSRGLFTEVLLCKQYLGDEGPSLVQQYVPLLMGGALPLRFDMYVRPANNACTSNKKQKNETSTYNRGCRTLHPTTNKNIFPSCNCCIPFGLLAVPLSCRSAYVYTMCLLSSLCMCVHVCSGSTVAPQSTTFYGHGVGTRGDQHRDEII